MGFFFHFQTKVSYSGSYIKKTRFIQIAMHFSPPGNFSIEESKFFFSYLEAKQIGGTIIIHVILFLVEDFLLFCQVRIAGGYTPS